VATTDFCCSAGCGIDAQGQSTGLRHWAVAGTGTVEPDAQQAVARTPGRWAYRFNTIGASGARRLQRDFAAGTVQTARFALYFATLPNANANLAQFAAGAGSNPHLRYLTATEELCVSLGDATQSAAKYSVTTGVWYIVEIEGDVASGTRAMVAQIRQDGESDSEVTSLSVTAAIAASTFTTFKIGNAIDATANEADVYFTDIVHSSTDGDYPLGDGKGIALRPNADGTHSIGATTTFLYNGVTELDDTTPADTYTYVDDVLDNTTDFMAASGVNEGEYLEWQYEDLPGSGVGDINGVQVTAAYHASATTAVNTSTLQVVDGGTVTDVFTDLDASETSLTHYSVHYATAPSTDAAWTATLVDDLKTRWGASWTAVDIDPVPYMDAVVLEVDYVSIPPTLTLNEGLACWVVDDQVQLSVGDPPVVGVEGAPGNAFVRQFGFGARNTFAHRVLRGEVEDR
jgi:hypothetical protein